MTQTILTWMPPTHLTDQLVSIWPTPLLPLQRISWRENKSPWLHLWVALTLTPHHSFQWNWCEGTFFGGDHLLKIYFIFVIIREPYLPLTFLLISPHPLFLTSSIRCFRQEGHVELVNYPFKNMRFLKTIFVKMFRISSNCIALMVSMQQILYCQNLWKYLDGMYSICFKYHFDQKLS